MEKPILTNEEYKEVMESFEKPCEDCGVPQRDCECMAEHELEYYLKAINQ